MRRVNDLLLWQKSMSNKRKNGPLGNDECTARA